MASTAVNNLCKECENGVSICTGCQQQFCMNQIGQQYNVLQQDFEQDIDSSAILSRIQQWREESIRKIDDTAKQLEGDVRNRIDHTKAQLKQSLDQIGTQLKYSQTLKHYTEEQLDTWMQRLKELRTIFKSSLLDIDLQDDDTQTFISKLKLVDRCDKTTLTSNDEEYNCTHCGSTENDDNLSVPTTSIDGKYKVTGYTKNSYDGNITQLANMTIDLIQGQLSGSGYYHGGSNYNSARVTIWEGSYDRKSIQWTEYYGDDRTYPFIYIGTIENNRISGTYKWALNQATGSFDFQLERLNH